MGEKMRVVRVLNKNTIYLMILIIAISSMGCEKGDVQKGQHKSGGSVDATRIAEFAATINESELREHVYYLASDAMKGRQSGAEGARAAARYIADHFAEADLQPCYSHQEPYFQKFEMERKELLECYLESEFGRVENWQDFLEITSEFEGEKNAELLFLGYGRKSDFEGIDITDKIIAMLSGDPKSKVPDRALDQKKINFVLQHGGIGSIFIIADDEGFGEYIRRIRPYFPAIRYYIRKDSSEVFHAPRVITLGTAAFAKLMGKSVAAFKEHTRLYESGEPNGDPLSITLKMNTRFKQHGIVPAENVLGYSRGEGDLDEWFIVTAHYDGRGMDGSVVLNGANDNATGVAAMLELAEAFSQAARNGHAPRRNLIFCTPAAEELGALGSAYYVENPAVPLEKTILNVNMDPLGREDGERPALKNHIFIYTSANGKEALRALRTRAEKGFGADLTIKTKENYTGSDFVNFETAGMPVLAYTTGKSTDNHGPGDDPEKVHYKKLEKITRLIFATLWEAANSEAPIAENLEL